MANRASRKVSASLPAEVLRYAEEYQERHDLPSRSDVLVAALKALREHELEEGYRAMAEEYGVRPDPLVDVGIEEGLEPSTDETW